MPLCHFQSSFHVLALCSHLPNPSRRTATQPVLLRALLLCHSPDTSFHPTNQCRRTFSAPMLLPQQFLRHLSVLIRPRFVGLPSQHCSNWFQPHSLLQLLTHTCLTAHFSNRPSWFKLHLLFDVLRANHSHVLSLKVAMCATAATLMSRSRVSHMTPPASLLTCFHVSTSKICFYALCRSFSHVPTHKPSAQESVTMVDTSSTSRSFTSRKSDCETDSF